MSLLIDALKKTDKAESEAGFTFSPSFSAGQSDQKPQWKKYLYLALFTVIVFAVAFSGFMYYQQHISSKKSSVTIKAAAVNEQPVSNSSIVVVNKPYQDALALINQKKYQEAIVLLNNDHLAESTHGSSIVTLAKVYLIQNKPVEAEQVIRQGIAANYGADDQLVGLLGQIQFQQGNYAAALETLKTASPLLDESPEYYALMARAYIKLKQPQPAIALFKQLIRQQPKEAVWWIGLGLGYQEAGNLSGANDAYVRAEKLNSDPQVSLFLEQQRHLILGAKEGS